MSHFGVKQLTIEYQNSSSLSRIREQVKVVFSRDVRYVEDWVTLSPIVQSWKRQTGGRKPLERSTTEVGIETTEEDRDSSTLFCCIARSIKVNTQHHASP